MGIRNKILLYFIHHAFLDLAVVAVTYLTTVVTVFLIVIQR